MEDTLLKRQAIVDNVNEIITTAEADPDQLNLFETSENSLIEIRTKSLTDYLNILENEREKLGLVLSVDYLRDVRILPDLLGFYKISEIDISKNIVYGVGICVEILTSFTKKGTKLYEISIADSNKRMKIKTYNKVVANLFKLGELFMVKLKIINNSEKLIYILKAKLINESFQYDKFISKPIKIINLETIFKDNKKKGTEFITFLHKLTLGNSKNYINLEIVNKNSSNKLLKIKFNDKIFIKFVDYFKLKITY